MGEVLLQTYSDRRQVIHKYRPLQMLLLTPFTCFLTVSLREELSQQMIFYFLDGEWECEPYPSEHISSLVL